MSTTTDEPRHQSGGLAVALSKLDLDALTVADAVADVANTAGENVTTAIRADLTQVRAELTELRADTKADLTELRAETNALVVTVQSLHREMTTLRWFIVTGFALLGLVLTALSAVIAFPSGGG